MLSNRVSFTFDLKGPSLSVDSGCSSSLVALQMAFSGIRSNQFDMAIVGTVNINLRPNTSLELDRLSMLSPDGKCKYLDASADGYVRSEAVSVVIIQRRKTARRIYATVIGAKTNSDGHKIEGIAYPSCQSQIDLMEALLKESAVSSQWIRYVEADGTGTPAGDLNESNAIYKVLCRDRSYPLSVGSVKSNLGHSESASGLCSVAKMLIAFESRRIPGSLHLQSLNPSIMPLIEGSILPLNENQDFEDSVVAINSFGIFGGTNAQILLRPHQTLAIEDPVEQEFHFEIPRLIVANGRTEDSVKHVLDFIIANPDKISEDFLALLNDVTTGYDSIGMDFRGFLVRDIRDKAFAEYQRKVSKVVDKRHVWFIISGQLSLTFEFTPQLIEFHVL